MGDLSLLHSPGEWKPEPQPEPQPTSAEPEPELQPQNELRKVHSASKPPTLRTEAWFKSFVAQTVKALEESFRLGASRVILVGIKGDIHRGQFTLREWPELMAMVQEAVQQGMVRGASW